jgi:hypothetical protein
MFKLQRVEDVDTLVKTWRRLVVLAEGNGPEVSTKSLLDMFLQCLNNGGVFFVRGDEGLIGFVCVEAMSDECVALRSVPRDKLPGLGKACLTYVRDWAKSEGFRRLFVSTSQFSGSNFKYFKHTLGMQQHSVTFSMKL